MTTFALVHGAYHGAWCWELLGPELESLGHRWVAPDLPCDDPAAGIVEYSSVVLDSLKAANIGDEDDDIVVVGHSLGGLTAPVVAANRPARQVVYLAAMVPEPSRSPSTAAHQLEVSETWNRLCHRRIVENGVYSWFPDDAIEIFFHDCTPQVAERAALRLRGQVPLLDDPSPLVKAPTVECRYIACADDRTVTLHSQLEAGYRLGNAPFVLPGGHSPFLARPKDLARALHEGLN